MKSERGITVISIIVYVIAMLMVVTILSVITSFFYQNVNIKGEEETLSKQYTKFTSFFAEEVALAGNQLLEVGSSTQDGKNPYIAFSSNHTFTYQENEKAIYRDYTKICDKVEFCNFTYEEIEGTYKINVEFKAGKFDRTGNNAIIYYLK